MALQVHACIAQHQGDREEQQDRVALIPHGQHKGVALAVVADGMGGHTGGSLAAEQVVHTAQQNLRLFRPDMESPLDLLRNSVNEAHEVIKATRVINEQDPHSTSVAMLLQPKMASWAHCGDSRFYHFREGKLVRRSRDHSYVEQLLVRGEISEADAATHPNKNILMTSIGGETPPTIDCGQTRDLRPGDVFLLCSDGLWADLSEAELGQVLSGQKARQAAATLIAQARDRCNGYGDNISLAILKLL